MSWLSLDDAVAILAPKPAGSPNEAVALHAAGFIVRLHFCQRGLSRASNSPPPPSAACRPATNCAGKNPKVVNMAKVAFLGLGVMAFPMAGHLMKKGGHEVTVYNRTPAKAAQWVKEYGGKSAATPKEAAQD